MSLTRRVVYVRCIQSYMVLVLQVSSNRPNFVVDFRGPLWRTKVPSPWHGGSQNSARQAGGSQGNLSVSSFSFFLLSLNLSLIYTCMPCLTFCSWIDVIYAACDQSFLRFQACSGCVCSFAWFYQKGKSETIHTQSTSTELR